MKLPRITPWYLEVVEVVVQFFGDKVWRPRPFLTRRQVRPGTYWYRLAPNQTWSPVTVIADETSPLGLAVLPHVGLDVGPKVALEDLSVLTQFKPRTSTMESAAQDELLLHRCELYAGKYWYRRFGAGEAEWRPATVQYNPARRDGLAIWLPDKKHAIPLVLAPAGDYKVRQP